MLLALATKGSNTRDHISPITLVNLSVQRPPDLEPAGPPFKRGPLAWNGMLARWLLLVGFFSWVLVMATVILGNLRKQGATLAVARGNDPASA